MIVIPKETVTLICQSVPVSPVVAYKPGYRSLKAVSLEG